MAYRDRSLMVSSDEQSDSEDEKFWKKRPSNILKRKALSPVFDTSQVKQRRNNVWSNVADECQLNDALSATNMHEKFDARRSVESYLVHPDSSSLFRYIRDSVHISRQNNRKHFEDDATSTHWDSSVSQPCNVLPELVKKSLVTLLNEPNEELIGQVVDVLGVQRTVEFYHRTVEVELAGGLYFTDGSRRRTKGGVFLTLIKQSDEIKESEKKAVFALTRQMKNKLKSKRRQMRRNLKSSRNSTITISRSDSSCVPSLINSTSTKDTPSPVSITLPDVTSRKTSSPPSSIDIMDGELKSTDE